jgi:hypothetical protein
MRWFEDGRIGAGVSIRGDTAIVRAWADDDGDITSGSAYVYYSTVGDVPTLSGWSLVAMGVLLPTSGALIFIRRRCTEASRTPPLINSATPALGRPSSWP